MSALKVLSVCLSFLVLAGCARQSSFSSAVDLLNIAVYGREDAPYTVEYVRQLPYASISAKIGKGQKSLLVLGKVDGDLLYWYSADRGGIVTQHGRVVKTIGFGTDLLVSRSLEEDPLSQIQKSADLLDGELIYTRMMDFSRHEAFGMPQRLALRYDGDESLLLLGEEYQTRRYHEVFEIEQWNWEGVNRYWLDEKTGRLLKAEQGLTPDSASVTIEFLKPFSG